MPAGLGPPKAPMRRPRPPTVAGMMAHGREEPPWNPPVPSRALVDVVSELARNGLAGRGLRAPLPADFPAATGPPAGAPSMLPPILAGPPVGIPESPPGLVAIPRHEMCQI